MKNDKRFIVLIWAGKYDKVGAKSAEAIVKVAELKYRTDSS